MNVNDLKLYQGDFPGGPVVKTLLFHCRGMSWIRGRGAKILHAAPQQEKQKIHLWYHHRKTSKIY